MEYLTRLLSLIIGDNWVSGDTRTPEHIKTRGHTKFQCPLDEGHFADPYDCSVYYQCAQGTPHRRQCETGLSWSVDTDMCDWTDNVICQQGQRP